MQNPEDRTMANLMVAQYHSMATQYMQLCDKAMRKGMVKGGREGGMEIKVKISLMDSKDGVVGGRGEKDNLLNTINSIDCNPVLNLTKCCN